jgi:hypothetical protein
VKNLGRKIWKSNMGIGNKFKLYVSDTHFGSEHHFAKAIFISHLALIFRSAESENPYSDFSSSLFV